MPETQDERVALALAALAEVTDPADVGPLEQVVGPEPGVVDLLFACALEGYPDWRWTVSTSALPGVAPTVLEIELLPGDGALLAPPWVPWTERLAEWRRSHPDDAGSESGDDDEDDDVLDADAAVDDEDALDGVEDALDEDGFDADEPARDLDESRP